jgi:hydrogenase expression/formation protein HypD
MKYIDEYRDPGLAKEYAERIADLVTRPWTLMEVCGGQTHAIVKFGIDQVLPDQIELIHGPGCPVCVTPVEIIDQALELAARRDVTFCTFGDMLRVPGTTTHLQAIKASGGDVRIVYSPTDAVRLAQQWPDREVVFFAVGFETTIPANAMAVMQARRLGLKNFSLLVSQVLVPPAMEAILDSPGRRVDGFLAAGHVCAVMGYTEYEPISRRYDVPIVVTGFEPLDILQGILMCTQQLEEGRSEVENQYRRTVDRDGNPEARRIMQEVFCVVPRNWRGVGEIPLSGMGLADDYAEFDAATRFAIGPATASKHNECISGLILQGVKKPTDCPAFGTRCSPDHPLGATMVSGEGACAAYYRYRRNPAIASAKI